MESISPEIAKRLPKYGLLPATLTGQLAVHGDQGEGLGSLLLMDALRRSWQAAHDVASYAVRVDATDERALDFYPRHDFKPFPVERLKLFLPMADLDRLFRRLEARHAVPGPAHLLARDVGAVRWPAAPSGRGQDRGHHLRLRRSGGAGARPDVRTAAAWLPGDGV
jgi:hypothetical protein